MLHVYLRRDFLILFIALIIHISTRKIQVCVVGWLSFTQTIIFLNDLTVAWRHMVGCVLICTVRWAWIISLVFYSEEDLRSRLPCLAEEKWLWTEYWDGSGIFWGTSSKCTCPLTAVNMFCDVHPLPKG